MLGYDQPMTHREVLLWRRYYADEWNEPSRTDHYLMSIAQTIRGIFGKSPSLNKMKIRFGTSELDPELTPEVATAYSRARLGLKPRKRNQE